MESDMWTAVKNAAKKWLHFWKQLRQRSVSAEQVETCAIDKSDAPPTLYYDQALCQQVL